MSPKTCLGTFSNEGEERDGCAENNVEREKVSTTRRTYPYARGPREATFHQDSSVSSPVTIVECGRWFVRYDTQWPRQARSRCPSSHHAEDPARTPAVAATTCGSQWRRDARVLGSLPLDALGSLGPLPLVQHPRWFESTSLCLRVSRRRQRQERLNRNIHDKPATS